MTSKEHKLKFGAKVEIDGELWVWERVRRGVEATLRRDGTQGDWLVISMEYVTRRTALFTIKDLTRDIRCHPAAFPTASTSCCRNRVEARPIA